MTAPRSIVILKPLLHQFLPSDTTLSSITEASPFFFPLFLLSPFSSHIAEVARSELTLNRTPQPLAFADLFLGAISALFVSILLIPFWTSSVRRSPYAAASCRCGPCYRLGVGLLLALLGAGLADGQVAAQTEYQAYALKHKAATDVEKMLRDVLSGRDPAVDVIADPRANSLIVQAAPRDMKEVELMIGRLDRGESEAVMRTQIFKLENSLAVDLGEILQQAIASAAGGTAAQKSAVLELLIVDAEGERLLKSGLLGDVQVTPNPRTNTLVVTAPAESMDLIAALIKQLDTPSAVAQIKVFRVVNSDATDMVTMLRTLLPSQTGASTRPQLAGAEGETSLVPVRFSVDRRTNSIIATGSEGDLRIVEALLLRLDEEDVQQRETAVYRLRNAPAPDVANAISLFLRSERQVEMAGPGAVSPFQRIEREVVVVPEVVSNSLILSATPRFFEDIMELIEKLDAEKSDLGPIQEGIPVSISEGQVIRSPSIELTMAQTTVSVADGETVVLGGLITKRTSTTKRRVPWLADIPLLGNLFRYDSNSEKRTELLIILTPHIVLSPDDAEKIKQVEASRMHWCLGDVHEIHGPTGLWEMDGSGPGMSAPEVIYPDLNPRGIIPLDQQVPTPAEPLNQTGPILPNNQQAQGPITPIGPVPPPYPPMYDPAVRQAQRNPARPPPIQRGGTVLR